MLSAEVTRNGSIDPQAVERAVKKWLPAAGVTVEGQAKELAPVDTGRLRGSITWATAKDRSYPSAEKDYTPNRADMVGAPREDHVAVVGTNVEYAEYMEYGTRFFRGGRPFLRPAIDIMRKRLTEYLAKLYDEEVMKTAVK